MRGKILIHFLEIKYPRTIFSRALLPIYMKLKKNIYEHFLEASWCPECVILFLSLLLNPGIQLERRDWRAITNKKCTHRCASMSAVPDWIFARVLMTISSSRTACGKCASHAHAPASLRPESSGEMCQLQRRDSFERTSSNQHCQLIRWRSHSAPLLSTCGKIILIIYAPGASAHNVQVWSFDKKWLMVPS